MPSVADSTPHARANASEWPPWVCPEHGIELSDAAAELRCGESHSFPRIGGIPRFVAGSTYSDAFGAQWRRYRLTQLDSHIGTTISEERARRCLGEPLWRDLAGRDVLEAGCGAGRFTEVLLAQGARVTSVDLSDAVEANLENFPQDERHRIAQADILHLPFARRQFDVVFSLGVVQHTPNPEQTIAALYEHVRPGGTLVFDHYSRRLGWILSIAPLFRLYLRRLPPDRGLQASERLVGRLLWLHRRAGRLEPVVRRVSPVVSYYRALPDLADDVQREWALLDTHDSLTDWYKHFRSERQIRRTLETLGLEEVVVTPAGNGVEARGKRPASPVMERPLQGLLG